MPDGANTWQDMVRRHADYAVDAAPLDGPHRPTAAVLACSDARVPPTLIFGQEPGSLFVVRLAGNSATRGAVASLTYAVEHLGTDLVVVLGHTGCGAVAAALDGHAAPTLDPILIPIDEMLDTCTGCDDVDDAVVANVRHNVRRLQRDRGPLGQAIASGKAIVRGAVHDLTTRQLLDVTTSDPTTHVPAPAMESTT